MTKILSCKKRSDKRIGVGVFLAITALMLVLQPLQPSVEGAACTTISSLPFTITSGGKYCLNDNLSYSGSSAAITIQSGNVLLDLEGYTISTSSNLAHAIVASGSHHSITVRNGTIRGFRESLIFGALSDISGSVVENMRFQDSVNFAIEVNGNGNIVRNNQVVNTRNSTDLVGEVSASAIIVTGTSNSILNNDIVDVIADGTATGILLNPSDRSIIENNRIEHMAGEPGGTVSILIGGSTNVLVVNNRILRSETGIDFFNSSGTFRDNIALGCTTKYSGGTSGGNNQ